MSSGLNQIIDQILAILQDGNETVLVLMAGGSCSGKTYISRQLVTELRERHIESTLVHLDNYFRDIDDPEIPKDFMGNPVFDEPESYHQHEIREHLSELLRGSDVECPTYNIPTNSRNHEKILLKASSVIIVDGLFAINVADTLCDPVLRVFVDAGYTTRLRRRIERDLKYGLDEERIRADFEERIEYYYQLFVEPQKKQADIVIVNESEAQHDYARRPHIAERDCSEISYT